MKRRVITGICMLLTGILFTYAQSSTEEPDYAHLKVTSVEKTNRLVPMDQQKLDFNGTPLAFIIVESPLSGLVFEGGGVYKNESGEVDMTVVPQGSKYKYTVGMLEGYNDLTVKHNEYHQAVITLPSKTEPNNMWRVGVEGVEAVEAQTALIDVINTKYPVNLTLDTFSDLYIDEVYNSRKPKVIDLEEGTHYLSSRYDNQEYEQKIDVKSGKTNNLDMRFGGEIVVKNASSVEFPKEPIPLREIKHKGDTYFFDNAYGTYTLKAKPAGLSVGSVRTSFKVGKRGKKTVWVDELVTYAFIMYHGTHLQPFGVGIGACKKFGFYASYSADAKYKVKTPYGDTHFTSTSTYQGSTSTSKTLRSTSMTFSGGPMWRVYRKLYLQVGGGGLYYLQTDEPKVLTPGFKYKWGWTLNADIWIRIKAFAMGVGYTKGNVKNAYDPNLKNQFRFSVGMAVGL